MHSWKILTHVYLPSEVLKHLWKVSHSSVAHRQSWVKKMENLMCQYRGWHLHLQTFPFLPTGSIRQSCFTWIINDAYGKVFWQWDHKFHCLPLITEKSSSLCHWWSNIYHCQHNSTCTAYSYCWVVQELHRNKVISPKHEKKALPDLFQMWTALEQSSHLSCQHGLFQMPGEMAFYLSRK